MEMTMPTTTLVLELPEELVRVIGTDAAAAAKAKEALVLELLREARITQGQAGAFLDLSRSEVMSLMACHEIPSGPLTATEVSREVDELRRFLHRA